LRKVNRFVLVFLAKETLTFLNGLFISGWYEQNLNIHNQKCFIKHANVTIAI